MDSRTEFLAENMIGDVGTVVVAGERCGVARKLKITIIFAVASRTKLTNRSYIIHFFQGQFFSLRNCYDVLPCNERKVYKRLEQI
jgi:hypothetical protein